MASATVIDQLIDELIDELIEALRSCRDLDQLQAHVASNETMDRYSPPLRDWLLNLVNTERRRRTAPDIKVEYPIQALDVWPSGRLVGACHLSCVIAEAACLLSDAEILNFAFRLQQLLVGLVGLRLLRTEG